MHRPDFNPKDRVLYSIPVFNLLYMYIIAVCPPSEVRFLSNISCNVGRFVC